MQRCRGRVHPGRDPPTSTFSVLKFGIILEQSTASPRSAFSNRVELRIASCKGRRIKCQRCQLRMIPEASRSSISRIVSPSPVRISRLCSPTAAVLVVVGSCRSK